MKRILLLCIAVALTFFSCKKDHSALTTVSGKKYRIAFTISNFEQQRASFSLAKQRSLSLQHNLADTLSGMAATNYLDLLYFCVFDANQHLVTTITQDSTFCDQFGLITDSLPQGQYTVAIVAGKNGLQINNSSGHFFNYGGLAWQDTFWDSFTITVGSSPISQDVTLNRIVGKLEVTLLDNVPANADSLFISVDGDAINKSLFDASSGGYKTTGFPVFIPASTAGKPNFTVDRLIGGVNYPFDVSLSWKDSGNHLSPVTKVSSITVIANEKTVLSGNLFGLTGNNNQQSFVVKVDTAWLLTNQLSF
jgi:hypothetical protein